MCMEKISSTYITINKKNIYCDRNNINYKIILKIEAGTHCLHFALFSVSMIFH